VKFLCDQCKAKYQISDDKVAGKTVRMKCRKCGHQIEVRAAVTETSVSTAFPSELPPPAPVPAGMTPSGASAGSGAKPAPAAPKPPAAPKVNTLATSLSSAARPGAPRPAQTGLAGAFKTNVAKDDGANLELSSTDEWYVAINGVPVGPVRIAELRRKAALGAVTDDSLVWQEGMEEWRIVKQIPELQAIVREAATSGRVSLLSPAPPDAKPSSQPPQSMRPAAMPRSMAPPRPHPPTPAAPTARSNVVPITSRLATAEKLEEIDVEPDTAHDRLSAMPDPFAMPSGAIATGAAAMAPPAAASAVAPPPAEQKKSPPWIVLGMLFMFTAFGVTAAFVLKPQPQAAPPPQVIIQQVPGPAAPTAAPAPADSAGAVASADPKKPTGPKIASAAPSATAKPGGPNPLLDGLGTPGGPKAPDLGLGGLQGHGGVSGTSLTQPQIEEVLRAHQLGVRRTCWERGASNSASANVTVQIKIGGNGQVTDANANGNDAVVGKCIEGDVKHWQFPPTGAPTTVNIPFHFVRQ
jgi:predicted Zn finger-like uncharacterized protein